ncbi:MAG TPA: amidohydrolase family protein [Xanthobacteraceae bacterium]|jgi:cytosine deaminase|nr:amidohydrolase family protein [Xanthobacteraceae bacterium]
MDLVLRNARIFGRSETVPLDIAIKDGRIVAIAPSLAVDGPSVELNGRLVAPGLVETHIHLDKTCIIDRCKAEEGTVAEAVAQTAAAKRAFTEEDIYARGTRTLEKCLLNGTMLMRTHVEIDPGIGLKGFEAVRQLAKDYAWAIDLELCVFPQEGLLNNPGTDELLRECLGKGAKVVGAVPYTDSDPRGQIDRIFAMARDFDVDIDMHLDLGDTPEGMQIEYVCDQTEKHRYGGRVAVGHVTQLSAAPSPQFHAIAKRLSESGVAVTVLPSTDLYLTGRGQDHCVMRGVTAAHKLLEHGVNCSLSTNNVLNPFTPYGDASLIRMANLYANVCHVSRPHELDECFAMLTTRSAQLLRRSDYGLAPGRAADLVVFDCNDAHTAVAELVAPLFGLKNGRVTFTRPRAALKRAGARQDLNEVRDLLLN